MKSIFAIFAVALLVFGCTQPASNAANGKLKVVASFYPMYDFAKNVGGDRVDVTSLIPPGVEPHNFEPTPSDMKKLSSADVLILNGAGLEHGWVHELVEGVGNQKLAVVDTSKEIELIHSEAHEHEAEEAHEAEEHHHGEFDPHIWLSPVNAKKQVEAIKDAFIAADPEGKAYYENNAAAYGAKLDSLDAKFKEQFSTCKKKDILITHATLAYFCREYGCNQVPVEGVNAEGEPTPAVVAAIVNQAKEKGITVVFVEKMYDPRVAQTISKEIGGKVAVFNTVHGLTPEEQANGEDYLSEMEGNLAIINANLDCS